MKRSLQILVHLEAVIAGVCDHDVTFWCKSQPLWTVKGVSQGVDERQEWTLWVEHLRESNDRLNESVRGV